MLLQYLKEQLTGGFADALLDDMAVLDRVGRELRQHYDSRDLQVGGGPAHGSQHVFSHPSGTEYMAGAPTPCPPCYTGCFGTLSIYARFCGRWQTEIVCICTTSTAAVAVYPGAVLVSLLVLPLAACEAGQSPQRNAGHITAGCVHASSLNSAAPLVMHGNCCPVMLHSLALQTLRCAKVVGMTTSGVARLQCLVAALQPKVLLIEEAGELLEAHTLASLGAATEHVILIGRCMHAGVSQGLHAGQTTCDSAGIAVWNM